MLLADPLVGNAGEVGKFSTGQGGRHDNLANRRGPKVRNVALAVGRYGGMQAIECLRGIDTVRETDLQDLDGVNCGSAADGQYQVRRCRTDRAGRSDDAFPRRMLDATVEQPGIMAGGDRSRDNS